MRGMARLTDDLKRQLAYEIAPFFGADPDLMSEGDLIEAGAIVEICARRARAAVPAPAGLEPFPDFVSRLEAQMVAAATAAADFGVTVKIAELRRLIEAAR